MSALMARVPRTISLMRRGGTLVSLASRYWLRPKGSRIPRAVFRQGESGEICGQAFGLLVVIDDLNVVRDAFQRPSQAIRPPGRR